MSSNFEFIQTINPVYYKKLDEIEKEARIRPQKAARNCRALLETFINDVFSENHLEKEEELYKNLHTLKSNQSQLHVPRIDKVEYEVIDKYGSISTNKTHGLYFIKDMGNAAAHVGLPAREDRQLVLLSSKAIFIALRVFHQLFTGYYGDQLEDVKTQFFDTRVPVGEYEITRYYVPTDTDRSKCIMEYMTTRKTGEFSKAFLYALVREYKPDEMDRLFLNRNLDAFSDAYSYTYANGVSVKRLNEIEEPYANFFIAYEFVRPIIPLDKFLKENKIELHERLRICLKIADSFRMFHHAEHPIYHRMLTHESILVSDFRDVNDGYRPYVTKFDFAKITSIKDGTVYHNLTNAEARRSAKWSRYRIDIVSPDEKWDKTDIYSLGVLFADILLNRISTKEITESTFEELERTGVSENLLNLIDEMLYETPDDRPGIYKVFEVLKVELDKVE